MSFLCCLCLNMSLLCCRCLSTSLLCNLCFNMSFLYCRCFNTSSLCCRCFSTSFLCFLKGTWAGEEYGLEECVSITAVMFTISNFYVTFRTKTIVKWKWTASFDRICPVSCDQWKWTTCYGLSFPVSFDQWKWTTYLVWPVFFDFFILVLNKRISAWADEN